MFFSVIIPVYNVEKYLNECVDSILSQTFKDFELILVNDGSKDSSPAICDEYAKADSRVKVIHKENGGASAARNVGTDAAKGEYILYIDSDDYVSDSDFFKTLYEKAQKGTDIIIYKFQKYFEETKKLADCHYGFPNLNEFTTVSERINYLVKTDSFYCSGWSKAIKAKVIQDNCIRFLEGTMGEDQEWYYRVLEKAETIDGIDSPYIVYRQRANSVTSSGKIQNLIDCVNIVDKVHSRIFKLDISEDYRTALLNSVAKLYCNLLIGYSNFNDKAKKTQYKKLKELSSLLKYNVNPRVATFSKIYKIFGFGITMFCLKIICKVR